MFPKDKFQIRRNYDGGCAWHMNEGGLHVYYHNFYDCIREMDRRIKLEKYRLFERHSCDDAIQGQDTSDQE